MKSILIGLFCIASMNVSADEEKTRDISISIKINCPMSDEYLKFVDSIPPEGDAANYEEWKSSFIHNMNELINLVESKKVYNASWTVHANEHSDEEIKKD